MAKEKHTEWEPRDPWTLGRRAAVYKVRLLPAQKLLGSKLRLPRPRSCGRKMLGAPCWPVRELTREEDLWSPVGAGPCAGPDESSDTHLPPPQYWPARLPFRMPSPVSDGES